jgi:hypothetical protein
MTNNILSEEELRNRLSARYSQEQIDEFIDQFDAASLEDKPDMAAIAELAKKSQEDKLLRVNFKLASEHYSLLEAYYNEPQRPATFLVQKALDEFIQLVAS